MTPLRLSSHAAPIGTVLLVHDDAHVLRALTGFGGGLPRKQWLLEHEGAQARFF